MGRRALFRLAGQMLLALENYERKLHTSQQMVILSFINLLLHRR